MKNVCGEMLVGQTTKGQKATSNLTREILNLYDISESVNRGPILILYQISTSVSHKLYL